VKRVSLGAREVGEASSSLCKDREPSGRELELAGAVAGGRRSLSCPREGGGAARAVRVGRALGPAWAEAKRAGRVTRMFFFFLFCLKMLNV